MKSLIDLIAQLLSSFLAQIDFNTLTISHTLKDIIVALIQLNSTLQK